VFYDWGLGSYHDKTQAGITGEGIQKNIQDGYRFIVQNYAPGDKIYLFGFSRGAYTVRAMCGLIYNCGILKREFANQIPRAWKMYRSDRKKNAPGGTEAIKLRGDHSHPKRTVHFVGVWDTVGALGIPLNFLGMFERDDEFYDTRMGSNITHARHALALDEKREDFEPTIWQPRDEVDLKQVWFAGSHTDVGNSYKPDDKRNDSFASDIPLAWLIREAKAAGLSVEAHLASRLPQDSLSRIHESHKKYYRLKREKLRDMTPKDKDKKIIPTFVHKSVKERWDGDVKYRPKNLVEFLKGRSWKEILER
jgi:uncharacterized protein (DUF2235 family)